MGYRVRVLEDRGVLHIRLDESWDRRSSIETITNLTELFRSHPGARVLVDVRDQDATTSPGRDWYNASVMGDSWRGLVDRIALVERPGAAGTEQPFESAARRAGLMVRAFADTDEALDWLGTVPARSDEGT